MYHSPHAGRRPSAETRENAVGYFKSAEEVDQYLGEMFRGAADHPEAGPKMKAAKITLRIHYSDPDCELHARFHDPMEVCLGPWSHEPDITMWMKGHIADPFLRGEDDLVGGMPT